MTWPAVAVVIAALAGQARAGAGRGVAGFDATARVGVGLVGQAERSLGTVAVAVEFPRADLPAVRERLGAGQ